MNNEIVGISLQVDGAQPVKTVGELRQQLEIAAQSAKAIGKAFGEDSQRYKDAVTRVSEFEAKIPPVTDKMKTLRQQIREAYANVDVMREKFGETSIEALNASKAAARLVDRMGDARAMVDAFNVDKKFAAVGQAMTGISGAFTATQGAMALLGVESESTQKALLKVQAALAITQGLNAITASIDGFKNLGTVIKATTAYQAIFTTSTKVSTTVLSTFGVAVDASSLSLKIFRTALIATGIGAFVVALGWAVEKLQAFTQSSEEAAKKQAEFQKELEEKQSKALIEATEYKIRQYDRVQAKREADLKAQGATQDEIDKMTRGYIELKKDEYRQLLRLGALTQSDEEAVKQKLLDLDKDFYINQSGERQRAYEKEKADREKRANEIKAQTKKDLDEIKKIEDAAKLNLETANLSQYQKDLKALEDKFKKEEALYKKYHKDTTTLTDSYYQDVAELNKANLDNVMNDRDKANDTALKNLSEFAASAGSEYKMDAEEYRKQQEAKQAANDAVYNSSSSLASSLSGLFGRSSTEGKAFALASIAIDEAKAIAHLIEASNANPYNAPTAGAAGAAQFIAGLAQIVSGIGSAISILNSGTPSVSGGGGSSPIAPTTNIINTTTTLTQQSVNQIQTGHKSIRAHIVWSDIENAQNTVNQLKENSTF